MHCGAIGKAGFLSRDQREWVFDVQEVKSEIKKLSLFYEKCKVKKNAFTLFREVQNEKKCFHSFLLSQGCQRFETSVFFL